MNPIIVTFVSEPYIPVGLNWLKAISALETGANIRIIALDEATKNAFPEPVILYRPVESGGLAGLWVHRTAVLRELLDQGFGVIHSDADAIWVRNPLPMMEACGTEMVFSQGTVWPPDVHARRGIVVCCGLFYMRSTPAVRGFMVKAQQQVTRDMEVDKGLDDQVAINRLIDQDLIKWVATGKTYDIEFRGLKFSASHSTILGESVGGPTVAVLPHHLFPRVVTEISPEMMVAHPFSGKTCAEKVEVLSKLGLWQV
jgi:hypothetical protein